MFLQGLTYQKLLLRLSTLKSKSDPLEHLKEFMQAEIIQAAEDDICGVCKKKLTNKTPNIAIPCKHPFHLKCVKPVKQTFICPVCSAIHGRNVPKQPPGLFSLKHIKQSCKGYDDVGSIQIDYDIPSGMQDGKHYHGTNRTCYLPDNKEGQHVAELLQQAFDKGLIFTIGRSKQTGLQNSVIFNGIHHKTSLQAGEFGYPDPSYLNRVISELEQKGIK